MWSLFLKFSGLTIVLVFVPSLFYSTAISSSLFCVYQRYSIHSTEPFGHGELCGRNQSLKITTGDVLTCDLIGS